MNEPMRELTQQNEHTFPNCGPKYITVLSVKHNPMITDGVFENGSK
jgi:hypothetical protein